MGGAEGGYVHQPLQAIPADFYYHHPLEAHGHDFMNGGGGGGAEYEGQEQVHGQDHLPMISMSQSAPAPDRSPSPGSQKEVPPEKMVPPRPPTRLSDDAVRSRAK